MQKAEDVPGKNRSQIFREIFESYDVNGDGYVSEEEVRLMVRQLDLPESYAHRIFETADLNNDGKISFEEMEIFVTAKLERLEAAFSYFDKDGSGSIDRREMYQVLQELCLEATEKDAEVLLQEIDQNDDGEVNFAEFLRVFSLLEPIDLLHHFDDVASMFELGSTTDFATARLRMGKRKSPAFTGSKSQQMATRLAAGGIAAVIAQACCQPIETIKVRLQNEANLGNVAKKYKSFSKGAMVVIAEEGFVRGLWKGMLPSAMRELSYSSLRFGLYVPIKKMMGATNPRDTPFWFVSFFCFRY